MKIGIRQARRMVKAGEKPKPEDEVSGYAAALLSLAEQPLAAEVKYHALMRVLQWHKQTFKSRRRRRRFQKRGRE